jgi:dienelactone hydrolase
MWRPLVIGIVLLGWCGSLCAAERSAYQKLRHDELLWHVANGQVVPVETKEQWLLRRRLIFHGMQTVMGILPGPDQYVPPAMKVESEEELEGVVRKKISFAVEPLPVFPTGRSPGHERISAYLLVPKGLTKSVPGILCLHQTTEIGKGSPAGLGDRPELHYGLELARRGYVTLCPDYPYFGESKGAEPYKQGYASATMKGIWNHMRAVDLLESLAEVEGGRIGAIGHSLGGHNALFVAAYDERIKAVVSNCGFNSFRKYKEGDLTGWSSEKYMPRIAKSFAKDPRRMPFDFGEVLAVIAPRAVMAIGPEKDSNFEVSGVRDCVKAAAPVFELLGAKEKLVAEHPDCGHEFPKEVRERAYGFLERELGR